MKCGQAVKKSKLFFVSFLLAAFFTFFVFAALSPKLPTHHSPLVFYTNQSRADFRLVLKRAFSKATVSIEIIMYALTDELILKKLHQKSQNHIPISIQHDASSGTKIAIPTIDSQSVPCKGLMHRKIVIIDHDLVFLGSTNLTPSSLALHDNLSIGIYHPDLAHFLKNPSTPWFDFQLENRSCRLWLLPDLSAVFYLQKQIEQAKDSIFIAMFTLTHTQLLQTLIEAQNRGVKVTVALDRYTAKGASQKAVSILQNQGIRLFLSQGPQLFHHKWAYIDQHQLILGSTNWTKAAFTKNQDCLLFMDRLSKEDQVFLNELCKTICLESNEEL